MKYPGLENGTALGRQRAWFEKEEAASKVREPGFKALILNL